VIIISRQVGEALTVGDDVEVTVAAIHPSFVTLDVRHSAVHGRLTLEDSFRRDARRDEVIDLPVSGSCTVVDIRGDKVRLGMDAPKDMSIHRKEVWEAIKRENRRERGLE
jgi:carbon storage regulator CsrA